MDESNYKRLLPVRCEKLAKECSVSGCQEKPTRKGMCGKHYGRLRATGTTDDPVYGRNICSVVDCGKPVKGYGFCAVHLNKQNKYGNPLLGYRDGHVKPPCSVCGGEISPAVKGNLFCSSRCQGRRMSGKTDTQPCKVCGSLFKPSKGAVCCSEECKCASKRGIQRESKAKARATESGKIAQYEANRKYLNANREKFNAYVRDRRKTDPIFRMATWARSVLKRVLERQNKRKDAKCFDLVGYTGAELKTHIERQFTKGMSWELVGESIHIDHIVSVAELMRNGETEPHVINALSNLRPMWAKENLQKSDKSSYLL